MFLLGGMGIEKVTAGPLEMFGVGASLLTQSSTEHHRLLILERRPGIEQGLSPWKGDASP